METNKLKFVNGEIFINAVKVNQVESIEIKSTSEQCSEVILKFDAVVKDLNFEPRKIEVDVSIGEKVIAEQILFEQQKTNELLQTIVSSKEPTEIKFDPEKVGDTTYSFIQCNSKEKAVDSSNCDRTSSDSIDSEKVRLITEEGNKGSCENVSHEELSEKISRIIDKNVIRVEIKKSPTDKPVRENS